MTVHEAVSPPWHARLELGTLSATFNTISIAFWARAAARVAVHEHVVQRAHARRERAEARDALAHAPDEPRDEQHAHRQHL